MPALVEDVPRIELAQIRALPSWNTIKQAGEVRLVVEFHGEQIDQWVRLASDETPYGQRHWFVCPGPRCGSSRRRHLYLHLGRAGVAASGDGWLLCRQCCAGGLLYYQQSIQSRWREEVGLPVLRLWRAARSAAGKTRLDGESS